MRQTLLYTNYLIPCRLSTDPEMYDLGWLWMARMFIIRNSIGCGQCLRPKMLSDIFSFSFTLLLPNWLLISISIYSRIARFPCDSMAFLLLLLLCGLLYWWWTMVFFLFLFSSPFSVSVSSIYGTSSSLSIRFIASMYFLITFSVSCSDVSYCSYVLLYFTYVLAHWFHFVPRAAVRALWPFCPAHICHVICMLWPKKPSCR